MLAAGASTRMGKRKEYLSFGQLTCLDLVLDASRRAGLGEPILVTRIERQEELKRVLSARGVPARIAVNDRPELGQTSSLRAGLQVLSDQAQAFLIHPVDYPLIRANDIERLCEVFVEAFPAATVVAPSFARRRGHPVIVAASVAPAILALPEGASAREALAPHAAATRYVDFENDRVLQDMDTPDDYARCLARWTFGD